MLSSRGVKIGGAVIVLVLVCAGGIYRFRMRRAAVERRVSTGRKCEACHPDVARSWSRVGMARSFRALGDSPDADLPAASFVHERSGRHYEVVRRGGRLVQRRYETDGAGAAVNAFELEATHSIGSGNHARTYLHRTAAGEFIELPLTWYPQERQWALSPGFDTAAPADFTRRADESCLFCHNGYPRGGATAQGIDCERCHGDGSRHAALAERGAGRVDVRAAIVNPARLPEELQLDVCMQCHLETTSVELPQMIRRFDREIFSFRAGEPLGAYVVNFDSASGQDRFEIVNQAYRLRQSACFRKSGGRLTCTTCHNPHAIARGEVAAAWLRKKCTACHSSVKAASHPNLATSSCAECHMPARRTEDAVHVIMTDHLISRRPPRGDLTATRAESARSFPGPLHVYYPELADCERDLYLGAALIVGESNGRAGVAMMEGCVNTRSTPGKAFAILAEGRLGEGDTEGAIRDFRRAIERSAATARVHYNLAQAYDAAGRAGEARREYEEALRLQPVFPEAEYALGNHLLQNGDLRAVAGHFQAAIAARPVYAEAHNNLGNALLGLGDVGNARMHFEEALRIDPAFAEAHENEARVLATAGQIAEAMAHARRAVALKPASVTARYNLGQLLQAMGSAAEAIAEYRRVLALDPGLAAAHLALGSALGDEGRLDAAIEEFRAALKLQPDNAAARRNLETALAMRGR